MMIQRSVDSFKIAKVDDHLTKLTVVIARHFYNWTFAQMIVLCL